MAILQEANAVFYHPLNDPTESLKSVAWGNSGAVFASGKVSLAMNLPGVDPLIGPAADYATNTSFISAAPLDATRFVIVYQDNADSSHGTAIIGTVSGDTIAYGAETEFLSADGSLMWNSVAALSATKFVVAYRDGADLGHGTAKVGTVSGTDITFGAETEFLAADADNISVSAISATKVVIAFNSPGPNGLAVVGDVVGSDITFGATHVFASSSLTDFISTPVLDSTKFIVAYRDVTGGFHGTVKVGTVNGTDITFGAEVEFLIGGSGPSALSASALSPTVFVVAYQDTTDSGHGTAKVGTVSGTDITFGAETEFWNAGTGKFNSTDALSSTTFAVTYSGGTNGSATTRVGTVSGTDITFGAETDFETVGSIPVSTATVAMGGRYVGIYQITTSFGRAKVASFAAASLVSPPVFESAFGAESEFLSVDGVGDVISTAALSATKFVVAYRDAADSNHGTAKIGTVSGTDITFGAETEFRGTASGISTDASVTALSATAFVVAYRSGAAPGEAKVGTVAGTDITFGAVAQFSTNANIISATTLSATKFVVAYQDGADSNHGTAKIGTVAGTDITFGAEAEFSTVVGNAPISVTALSPTAFVVAAVYAFSGSAHVGTVSGTAITFGPGAPFRTGVVSELSAVTLSATKFVVAYRDTADSNHGTAKIGTVSGTDIMFGAETEFLSAGDAGQVSAAALDSTTFVVSYRDVPGGNSNTKVGTVSGTSIAFGAESEFLGNTIQDVSASALSATEFVVAYQDFADMNHGAAKVGATAPSYPTAVGAARLAFSSWSRL